MKKTLLISSSIVVVGIAVAIIIYMFSCGGSAEKDDGAEKIGAYSVEEFVEILEESISEADFEKYLTIMPEFYVQYLENDENNARLIKEQFEENAKQNKSYSCVIAKKERATEEEIRELEDDIRELCTEEFGFEYEADISEGYHVVLKEIYEDNYGSDEREDNIYIIKLGERWYFYE